MTYKFCTFFDKKYIFQGLALYYSLEHHSADFKLWILCMDDATYDLLKKLSLPSAVLVRLSEFEDERLLAVKHEIGRNYFGTVKTSFIWYLLARNPDIDVLTYVDSDIFFFVSPSYFLDSFIRNPTENVLIVPHRYTFNRKYYEVRNGIYNAGVAVFKNTAVGFACANEWREQCLKYCVNVVGPNPYGDQHYMDHWPTTYSGTVVFGGKGANTAPWNVGQYDVHLRNGSCYIDEDPLIFYHFSLLRIYGPHSFHWFDYSQKRHITRETKRFIYQPYIRELEAVMTKVLNIDTRFTPSYQKKPKYWTNLYYNIKFDIVQIHLYLKKRFPRYSRVFYSLKNLTDQ